MSIGLDTSVVLRLLTGQPSDQATVARDRLQLAVAAGEEVLVTDLVLGEVYFALQHHYGVAKEPARTAIAAMLRSGAVVPDPADAGLAFEATKGAGILDRLMHARHRAAQATTLTFDRKTAALEGATRLAGERSG